MIFNLERGGCLSFATGYDNKKFINELIEINETRNRTLFDSKLITYYMFQ